MKTYDYKLLFNWLATNCPDVDYEKEHVLMTIWQYGDYYTYKSDTLEACIMEALAFVDEYDRWSDQ